jgi:hypothetical protein
MFRTSNFTQILVLSLVVLVLFAVGVYIFHLGVPFCLFGLFGRRNSQVFIESVSGMGSVDVENGVGVGGDGGGVVLTENDIRLEDPSVSRSDVSSIRNDGSPVHRRVLLLGDSTLDNAMYVPPKKSIYSMLRGKGHDWDYNPVMYASDGFTIADVYRQVGTLPIEYNTSDTVIVLSVGGNDFLSGTGYSTATVDYRHLIERIRDGFGECRLYLMNLYQPVDPALAVFREVVKRWNVFLQGFVDNGFADGIVDINGVLVGAEDFVHKIEPSVVGGQKIVSEIVGVVGGGGGVSGMGGNGMGLAEK